MGLGGHVNGVAAGGHERKAATTGTRRGEEAGGRGSAGDENPKISDNDI